MILVYRVTFHPLAKYPGPTSWALTGWPYFSKTSKGVWHLHLQAAHDKYGPIVRYAPDCLSFASVEAVYDIYDKKANVIKTGFTETSSRTQYEPTMQTMSDRVGHAQRRRIMANAFSESAIRNLEPLIIDTVNNWLRAIGDLRDTHTDTKGWTKPINMSTWSTNLTMDVLGELCFGQSFDAIKNGHYWMADVLLSSARFTTRLAALPFREWLYPIVLRKNLLLKLGLNA